MVYTEWNEDLVAALAERFPEEAHRPRQVGGGSEVTYVPVWDYVHRLNATVGPHGWNCETECYHAGGQLIMTVALAVLGVTKTQVGDEAESVESYGSPATNAYAQAFKRAAAQFGMGLYLYEKEQAVKGLATGKQRDYISQLMDDRVLTDKQVKWVEDKLSGTLSKEGASTIIEKLNELPSREDGSIPF